LIQPISGLPDVEPKQSPASAGSHRQSELCSEILRQRWVNHERRRGRGAGRSSRRPPSLALSCQPSLRGDGAGKVSTVPQASIQANKCTRMGRVRRQLPFPVALPRVIRYWRHPRCLTCFATGLPPFCGRFQTSGNFTNGLSHRPDLVGELDRRQVSDRAVGPVLVVVPPPGLELLAGIK